MKGFLLVGVGNGRAEGFALLPCASPSSPGVTMIGILGAAPLPASSGVTIRGMEGVSCSPDIVMDGGAGPSSGVIIMGILGLDPPLPGASTEILGMDGVLEDGRVGDDGT